MEFLEPALQAYVDQHCDPEPELLARLNRDTYLKMIQPRMLSGHVQGRILAMLTKLLQPKLVVEVGTFTGYSALCFAEGLAPGGTVHTWEVNAEFAAYARGWIEQAALPAGTIVQHVGSALEGIPQLQGPVDLAFLDGEKEEYIAYYEAVIPKLRPGGIILADNVLWSGKVVDKNEGDQATKALRAFNSFVMEDDRVEKVLLPLRDGVFVLRKKS